MKTIPFFIPVVHIVAHRPDAALHNFQVLRDLQVGACFLISHQQLSPAREAGLLLGYQAMARMILPADFWIGVNYLQLGSAATAAKQAKAQGFDGVWADYVQATPSAAYELKDLRSGGLSVFGGAAFKYINDSAEPAEEVTRLHGMVDVLATSGTATGSAPAVAKLAAFRAAIHTLPVQDRPKLACASGVSHDNVEMFFQHLDHVLVNTSLQDAGDELKLDPEKVQRMQKLVDMLHHHGH